MSRVVLVLVLAVVAFALTLNLAPEVVERFLFQPADSPADSAAAANAATELQKQEVRKKPASSKRQEKLPLASAPMTNTPTPAAVNQPASHGKLRTVFVSTEDAALYSANAPGGVVISQLHKGEVVEPQYTLSSAGQEWTFVSVAEQKVSGFLRSDSLGKKQVADETTSR